MTINKYKIYLIAMLVIISLLCFSKTILAAPKSADDKATKVSKSISIQPDLKQTSANSFAINVTTTQTKDGKKPSVGFSGSPQKSCYLWYRIGSGLETMNGLNMRNASANQSSLNNESADFQIEVMKYLRAEGSTSDDMSITSKGAPLGKYSLSGIFGNKFVPLYFKYQSGKASDEEIKELSDMRGYLIVPNQGAMSDFGENARCGEFPGSGVGSLIVTMKPVVGPIDLTQIPPLLEEAKSKVDVHLDLTQASAKVYTAKINFLGENNSDEGIAKPDKPINVTYFWSVRVPDKTDPLIKTQKLYTSIPQISTYTESSMQKLLDLKVDVGGGDASFKKDDMLKAIQKAYNSANENGSTFDLTTYHKSLKDNYLEVDTIKSIKNYLNNEKTIFPQLDSNAVSEYQVAWIDPKNSGTDADYTSTFNLGDFLKAHNVNSGKIGISVSAVINGQYVLPVTKNAAENVTFNYLLGFASKDAESFTDTCASIAAEMVSFNDQEVTKASTQVGKIEQKVCNEEVWTGPKAVGKIKPLLNGNVELSAIGSTGASLKTTTSTFKANTKPKCLATDPKTGACTNQVIVYDGTATKQNVGETVKKFPITGYIWDKKYRVFNVADNKYEIDLKSDVSKNPVRSDGNLYSNTTFACVGVTTNAPPPYNYAGGGLTSKHADGLIKSSGTDSEKVTILEQYKKNKPINCDYIIDNTQTSVNENWQK